MMRDIIQLVVALTVLVALAIPLGRYMFLVFTGGRTWLDPVLDPVDNAIYRIAGLKKEPQGWWRYVRSMLIVNLVMWLIIFGILLMQQHLPLNPDGMGKISPFLAFNTTSSFMTNTDWQNYGGESTVSYFTQMFALIFPMFTSAATGLACGVAFIRGLGGRTDFGNFYVDLTRALTRLLLPAALVLGVVLVSLGVPATFSGSQKVNTLNGPLASSSASAAASATPPASATPTLTSQGLQVIARGPVAPFETIKQLGTNGGGFFNANSSHPFENPRPLTNVMAFLMMATIPAAIIVMLGFMLKRKKQALVFFGVMAALFVMFLAIEYAAETHGNPLLNNLGLNSAQGNMEGKEVRFGQAGTSLFVTGTTAFTTGAVDSMHDSLTPLGGVSAFSQMFLQMVFGGKGVGFIALITFAIITVFLIGLMVGRTPEFLGKKIEAKEVQLCSLAFLVHPAVILIPTAVTFALRLDPGSILNPGPHGFSEVLYQYTSQAANNGSAFAGLNGNTNWFNISGGIVMLLARYLPIIFMLAVAGSLAAKKPVAETLGTMKTDTLLFGIVLFGASVIIILLTFFPVYALGPIVEHFQMAAGQTY